MKKFWSERGESNLDFCEVFLAVLFAVWVAKGCGII